MNAQELARSIKEHARSLGFDDVGIASAHGTLPYAQEVAKALLEGRFGPLDYLTGTVEARVDLKSIFPRARSVVMVVKNYYVGDHDKNGLGKAKIARYAWGKDYHQWFKKRLRAFKPLLERDISAKIEFWPFNDTGPFLERSWAHKAGLGFLGKSAMFIHKSFGTWTLLGGFATDVELIPDPAYSGPNCGTCTRCIDFCPTRAIIAPGKIDANRCISTWTIERPLHRDSIKNAPRNHDWVFGCDICQEVCPWNKFQQVTTEDRFRPIKGRMFLDEETFREDLRGSPLNRSRKPGLLVNYLRIRRSLSEPNLKIFFK